MERETQEYEAALRMLPGRSAEEPCWSTRKGQNRVGGAKEVTFEPSLREDGTVY